MNAEDYWTMFIETGAPEIYLLYTEARKLEEADVYHNSGVGSARF